LGDAYASINPVYGQGVGIAAWQAALLRDALGEASGSLDRSWSSRYLAAAGTAVAQAWALDDVPVPALSVPTWIALASRLAVDPDLHRRYVGLWHLVEPNATIHQLATEIFRAGPATKDA